MDQADQSGGNAKVQNAKAMRHSATNAGATTTSGNWADKSTKVERTTAELWIIFTGEGEWTPIECNRRVVRHCTS